MEADKWERAEKLAREAEESVQKITAGHEKVKREFSEHEEAWTVRAKTAEENLKAAEGKLAGIKDFVHRVCTATFGKLISLAIDLSLCIEIRLCLMHIKSGSAFCI